MLTDKDIKQIKSKGLSQFDIESQLENLRKGFPYVNIIRPAIINDGIIKLSDMEVNGYAKSYNDLNPDTIKFVPASGAASRMFKFLFEFYESSKDQYNNLQEIDNAEVKNFFENLNQFAFYSDLENVLRDNKLDLKTLLEEGKYKEILKYFLFDDGLSYGDKPKGVLSFHNYGSESRTAFEEHLAEGLSYAKSENGVVKIHFTISNEHEELFQQVISNKLKTFEEEHNIKFEITFSQQKPSTDMVAVDLQNELFKNEDNSLLFRPGGHGALIENLNDLNADIIFIKNIDNVVPDSLKQDTILYKKALAGILLSYQEKIFNYIQILESNEFDSELLMEIESFVKNDLCYNFSGLLDSNTLIKILNRPIRVCGMVKNEGEPGGGPFWVKQNNGMENLQIIESAQIDQSQIENKEIIKSASHFNPVDLICATKNYKGEKFDLLKYRDSNTGFISKKSQNGKELKAQELPGLWNGAMANWNTIFVEVPIITFNPVKTVNDLLRKEHQ
jgi:hypothetical protein